MPLKRGKSSKVIGENISELHTGKTFAHTKKKFGKKRAQKQAVAIALSEARKSGKEISGVGHNPPKPHHGKERAHEKGAKSAHKHELVARANQAVPAHLRGRGMISGKALAIMGKHLPQEAIEPSGPHVAAAGKSHAAHGDAQAAKPWKGHKLPGRASPEHGKHDAARAHAVEEHTN